MITILGVKAHNGYNSCLKCTTEGEWSYQSNCTIFPELNSSLRTDAEFRARVYQDHHRNRSILESVIGLDMINDFPIGDVLHLIDLGITKRFLSGFRSGDLNNFRAKWSANTITLVSHFLIETSMPVEIKRPLRSLSELKYWKGTEFRTFLLYASPIVMMEFFETETAIRDHFLNYFCAITIFSRHDQCRANYYVARSMISDFLKGVKILYGSHMFTSNLHNLSHLADDVERFGPLDTFSAYPFESKLYHLKRLIRTGNLPLAQVSRRIIEIQENMVNQYKRGPHNIIVKKKCKDYSTLNESVRQFIQNDPSYEVYFFIKLENYCLDTSRDNDKWILLKNFNVISMECILHSPEHDSFLLFGYPLKDLADYSVKPVKSSSLQIYSSNMEVRAPEFNSLDKLYCKMVKVTSYKCKPNSVLLPLLHTLYPETNF